MKTFSRLLSRVIPVCAASALLLSACDEDVSGIGGSLSQGEVSIAIDSLHFDLDPHSFEDYSFDTRSLTNLIGRIRTDEYGSLRCSYVSRLMCSQELPIPDSISYEMIDSAKFILTVPRGALSGDSLAPQQLKIYRLTKDLPNDIAANFDPAGYYDGTPMGQRSFTLSALGLNDSTFKKKTTVEIPVTLPREFAVDVVKQYRTDPSVFAWPATFNKFFKGIYVEPSFGSGCIANVSATRFFVYSHHRGQETIIVDNAPKVVEKTYRDSVALFATSPEVLNSNNITYEPSQYLRSMVAAGKTIITTPGGFRAHITIPAKDILDRYVNSGSSMGVITNLSLSIPASKINNDLGIGVPPYLLLIKTSELESFFNEGKLPDDETSFWASYSEEDGRYRFSSMRKYIVAMSEKQEITPEDTDFTLVPVLIENESYTNYGQTVTVVTRCVPYILKPTMCQLETDKAMVVFTYSLQSVK